MGSSLESIKSLLGGEDKQEALRPVYEEILPETIRIEGASFKRLPRDGNYKVVYASDSKIAMLPNPSNDSIQDLETQVAVWEHNNSVYEENGLSTAADYDRTRTEINGERYPLLVGDYNQHLTPLDSLHEGLFEDKWSEIAEYTIELDRLKRQGKIATAEPAINWEKMLGDYDIVIDREMKDNEVDQDQRVSSFKERPYNSEGRDGNYILEDFLEALWNNERVEPDKSKDIYLKEGFYPKEVVLKEGLPTYSSKTLMDSLSYDEKAGSIVIDDLGEYSSTMFTDETDSRFDSEEQFLKHNGIASYKPKPVLSD